MSDKRFPPDGNWSPGPAIVEITLYESRHLAHVIEIRTERGLRHRSEVPYEERTPLFAQTTSDAVRDLLREVAPWR
jgi:hypothetical protein